MLPFFTIPRSYSFSVTKMRKSNKKEKVSLPRHNLQEKKSPRLEEYIYVGGPTSIPASEPM
jgi:hypothetical protein